MSSRSAVPLCCLVACLAFIAPHQAAAQEIPTPVSVLGHTPGDDFYLADYADTIRYFHALAASSDRIKMFTVGKSTHGQDIEVAVISSPANLAKLDESKKIAGRLARAEDLNDDQAKELARSSKVIVHIDGGLHSDEVAGTQHTMILAYKLVSAQNDPEIDAILDKVILVLWPTLNPDGQDMVVHWYRQNLGTKYEVSPLPWLYQEYVGHDNNRDGYMMNMKEEQVVAKAELEYSPDIFYCQHQTAPFPARIWIPPFSDPISSNISPYVRSWLNVVGTNMAAYLDAHNMPGAISESRFDNWYAGFTDWAGVFRNEISFFTETALYEYATPRFYTVDDFPKEFQDLRALCDVHDAVGGRLVAPEGRGGLHGGRIDVGAGPGREEPRNAALQPLPGGARQHPALPQRAAVCLRHQRQAGRHPGGRAAGAEDDRQRPRCLRDEGRLQGQRRDYPAGSWVIPMDQPFSALAKELFERQHYPDALEKEPNPIGPALRREEYQLNQ